MAYSQGGLIQATDYNGFVGTSPSSTVNQINTIWAVGSGAWGYGQTPLTQVSSGGTVTATQWASAINTLNSIKTHQTGTGTGIGAPTAGTLVAYLSTFSSSLTTAYTSARTFNSQGTTVINSNIAAPDTVANTNVAISFSTVRTATFAGADQARYFFNAGGQLNYTIAGVTNVDGTGRSGDMLTLLATNMKAINAFRANTNGGIAGTGGTVTANVTTIGYYSLTTSNVTLANITSTTTSYTNDYANIQVKTNGVQGSNNDNGSVISFGLNLYSAPRTVLSAPSWSGVGTPPVVNTVVNDSLNIIIQHHIDVVYPETTNLTANTWGAVTVA